MSNQYIPRIVVAGLRGGSGKTIVSLSLISVLRQKGLAVAPFKKGPDYIDAGWLARASGVPCYNLDLFMMTPDQVTDSFCSRSGASQISVIEGNRGLYDGIDAEGHIVFRHTVDGLNNSLICSFAPDMIVDVFGGTVEAYLQVKHFQFCQTFSQVIIDDRPVSAHTGHQALCVSIVSQINKVLAHKRFAAADIYLEHLQGGQLIHQL